VQRLSSSERAVEALAPRSVPRPTARPSGVAIAIGVVLFIVAVALPFARDPRFFHTLWAEDGQVYWQQAHDDGGLAVLFRGYRGYIQLPPRLIAAVVALLPIDWLASASALAATVAGALVAVFTYWASRDTIGSRLVRLALVSLLVIGPALGSENTATYTNVIWVLAAAAPVALLTRQGSTAGVVARSAVLFLAATSSPLGFVFVPLALVVLVARRHDRSTWFVSGVFGIGLAVQALGMAASGGDTGPELYSRPGLANYTQEGAARVFSVFVLGTRGLVSLWTDHQGALLWGSTLAVVVIFAMLFVGAGRRAQLSAAALLVTARPRSSCRSGSGAWPRSCGTATGSTSPACATAWCRCSSSPTRPRCSRHRSIWVRAVDTPRSSAWRSSRCSRSRP
jgi:hypothetical protein